MASETLKEYLVKLGWNVDKDAFNNASSLVDKFSKDLISKAGKMGTAFLSASATILKFSLEAADAISDFAFSIADADLEVERLARQYWISEQQARSLTNALDQLGLSFDDLNYATEEQYNRFLQLNAYGKSMEAPSALDDTLVKIRDIQFEVAKLKTTFSYAGRWIMYYLGEYLGYDIDELINKFYTFNSWLRTNLPSITQKIAKIISYCWRFAKTVLTLIYYLGKGIVQLVERLGTSGVTSILALAAAFKLISSGPLGWILMALTAIVLLLDDYMVWKQGGKSLFDWSGVAEPLEKLWSVLLDVADILGTVFDLATDIFEYVGSKLDILSQLQQMLSDIGSFLDLISAGLSKVKSFLGIKDEESDATGSSNGFGGDKKSVVSAYRGASWYMDLIKGDWTTIWQRIVANGLVKQLLGGNSDTTSSAYSGAVQNTTTNTTNVGDINVTVGGSNSSAYEIGSSVADSIIKIQHTSNSNTRMTR